VRTPYPDVTGALIAGGRASRMGGAVKGLLRVDGQPIAARALGLFEALFAGALVVANDPAPYAALGARIVPDAIAGKGAPGGVHAALAAAPTPWVFTAACDMPFVSAEGVRFLAARREGADAVIVRWQGHLQFMHALWSRACLGPLERLLAQGDPSLWDLAGAVRVAEVAEAEWAALDPAGRAFENANTPADLARLGLALPR
jgi:molybdopterin-guanine dinucleotide biosynthesis protein A